jgi:hypothetical protein
VIGSIIGLGDGLEKKRRCICGDVRTEDVRFGLSLSTAKGSVRVDDMRIEDGIRCCRSRQAAATNNAAHET